MLWSWLVFEAKPIARHVVGRADPCRTLHLELHTFARSAAWGSVPMPFQIPQGNRRLHELTVFLGLRLPRLREGIGVARKLPDQNTWIGFSKSQLLVQERNGILDVAEHSQAVRATRVHSLRPQGSCDMGQLRFTVANPTAPMHRPHKAEDPHGHGLSLISSLDPLMLNQIMVDVLVDLKLGIG